MRILVALVVAVVPSVAAAEIVGGNLFTVSPIPETGSLGGWVAGGVGPVYVGGEIALETLDLIDADVGISYHVLVGHRHALSERLHVLVDAGIGVTQEIDVHLALFGGESETESLLLPSGAVRAQLAIRLGRLKNVDVALGVGSEARGAFDSDESAGGISVGLAMVLSGASAGR